MALIKCPECQKEISSRASVCPNCGFPIEEHTAEEIVTEVKKEKIIFKPGMIQNIYGMQVDKKNRTFKCGLLGEVLSFDDILDVDIYENGSSLTKTSAASVIGRAAVGSLFSPAGALIGGLTAKRKTEEIVNKLEIQITVRSNYKPLIAIPIALPKKTKKDSKDYTKAIKKARETVAAIQSLKNTM